MGLTSRREGDCTLHTASRDGEVLGYVAIHTTVAGRACGGLRMMPDVSESEICGLARAMTLKYGILGLPQGGAKAGVLGDPDAAQDARRRRLVEFGRVIAPLLRGRLFAPCADMGTDALDMRHMLGAVGVRVGLREQRNNSSGLYTAMSVLAGTVQSASHVGLRLEQCTAAIEGFGKVGAPLGRLLGERGVKIVAVSTSRGALYNPEGLEVSRLIELSGRVGSHVVESYPHADRIDRRALLELPVDILCPCARHDSIAADNAARIRARIICPGANNPVTPEAHETLTARGVLCMPDFLTNCGGVLGGTMEFASIAPSKIAALIESSLGAAIAAILRKSAGSGRPPGPVARELALRRFEQVKRIGEHPGLAGRLLSLGLVLYRQGIVPSSITAPLAERYFRRLLVPLAAGGVPELNLGSEIR